jgi:hypothetical protein
VLSGHWLRLDDGRARSYPARGVIAPPLGVQI